MAKQIIITGVAGFIGYNLSTYLLNNSYSILGIDNLNNDLESKKIKKDRLLKLKKYNKFKFIKRNIKDKNLISRIKISANYFIHLAASVSVRDSINNPDKFIENNIKSFLNILEIVKNNNLKLVYASSSSIYNDKINKIPFSENEKIISPNSIYGFTKLSNEKIAKIYNEQFGIKSIGLRFFTVYGDYPRLDMAIFKFIDAIYKNKTIKLFNHGKNKRDFTHVLDICEYIKNIIESKKNKFPDYEIFNIGSTNSLSTQDLVKKIEKITKKKARIEMKKSIYGENVTTKSSIKKIRFNYGKNKQVSINEGLIKTINWYKIYNNL